MKLKYEAPARGRFLKGITEQQGPIARAVTTAFREAAKQIEDRGRANIAGAGFTRRWQSGFRVTVTPRQFSLRPVIRGTHRIGFVNIFERGGRIGGEPLLWLPLPTAPKRIAGKRTTAAAYAKEVGPLISINRPGKAPLLAGQALRAQSGRASLAALRTGARHASSRRAGGRGRRTVLVPLFVGIRQAQIRKRFNVSPIYDAVRGQLGELYLKNFQQQGG